MPLPPQLRVGTGWIPITATRPVDMIACFERYAPILPVKKGATGQDFILCISAKSLTEQLEPLRTKNGGEFNNLKFSIWKESEDQIAKYKLKTV